MRPNKIKSLAALALAVVSVVPTLWSAASSSAASAAGPVSGTVFRDSNWNGTKDTAGSVSEAGVEGVTITAYGDGNTVLGTDTTDNAGNWAITVPDVSRFEVDAATLPTGMFQGISGLPFTFYADGGSTGHDVPAVYAAEYPAGGPVIPSATATNPLGVTGVNWDSAFGVNTQWAVLGGAKNTLREFNADSTARTSPTAVSCSTDQVGTTFGLTYDIAVNVYQGAWVKRHAALGTTGSPTSIYKNCAPWVDLAGASGTPNPHGSDLGVDAEVIDNVGRDGVGGMDISSDTTGVYAVNMTSDSLSFVDFSIASGGFIPSGANTWAVPNHCGAGPSQAAGLTVKDGKVYVASSCEQSLGYYVDQFDEATHTWASSPVLSGTHNAGIRYTLSEYKAALALPGQPGACSPTGGDIDYATVPWNDTNWIGMPSNPACTYPQHGPWTLNAQLLITDLDFTANGDMVLAARDRVGDLWAYQLFFGPSGEEGSNESITSNGDIIAAPLTAANTWTPDADSGLMTEVFNDNVLLYGDESIFPGAPAVDISSYHQETGVGSVMVSPGSGRIMATQYDPLDCDFGETGAYYCWSQPVGAYAPTVAGAYEQGIRYYESAGGRATDALSVVINDPRITPGLDQTGFEGGGWGSGFAKGNGLGDLAAIPGIAPVSIGNQIFMDVNANGVQDPTDTVVPGVVVELWTTGGTLLATDTTDTNGEFLFWVPGEALDYVVKIPTSQTSGAGPLAGFSLATADASVSDESDFDGTATSGPSGITSTVDALVSVVGPGQSVRHVDFGFLATMNLSLSKVLTSASPAAPGSTATFELTPHNDGPATAQAGWKVTDVLPPTLALVSMSGTGYTCVSNVCTSTVPLAAGADGAVVTVTATVSAGTTAHNVAYVSPLTGDTPETNILVVPSTSTDTDSTATDNDAQADLVITTLTPNTPGIHLVKYINNDDANVAPGVLVGSGSTMAFTFEVSNTGTVPLDGVQVQDTVLADADIVYVSGDTNLDGLLDTTEVWFFEASLAAPGDGGTHFNSATASGSYLDLDSGTTTVVSDSDPANAWVPGFPAIELVKTVEGADANVAPGVSVVDGSTMNFEFVVTNTGSVPLTNVRVTDNVILSASILCPVSALAVGESMTCTATYPAPAVGAQHTNTATVTGDYVQPSGQFIRVTDGDPANAYVPAVSDPEVPGIEVVKKINGADANSAPGVFVTSATMNVTFDVTNTGTIALTNVVVTDDVIPVGDIACPATTLAVGATMMCTATTTAPAAGTVHTNVATATADYIDPTSGTTAALSDTDSANAWTAGHPAISLVKTINGDDANTAPGVAVAVGSTMTIELTATNTGDVALANVLVTDNTLPDAAISCPATTLAVGASMVCTASLTAPLSVNTLHTNVASVTAQYIQPTGVSVPVSDSDPANAHTPGVGAINIVKYINDVDANSAPGVKVPAGSTMDIKYVVTNPGSTAVDNIIVLDNLVTGIVFDSGDVNADGRLDTTETWVYVATYAAPTVGTVHTNIGSVEASYVDEVTGTPITLSDTDPANAWVQGNPELEIVKYINGDDANAAPGVLVAAGSTMNITFVVTNTGDVPLTDVTVTDNVVPAASIICPATTLAVGAAMTCTTTLTAPAYSGTHSDTGTAKGKFVQPDGTVVNLTDTDPANAHADAQPGIDITKYINGNDANAVPGVNVVAGSTMSITFVVKNTKSVPLTNVVVTDSVVPSGAITCPTTTLAPAGSAGDTMTCVASFPAPQPGSIHSDTATVTGDYTNPAGTVIVVTDADPANAWVAGQPALTLVKYVNGVDANTAPGLAVAEGSTMNFTFVVTNPSSVALTNLHLTDSVLPSGALSCPATTLAPLATMTCTASLPAPAVGGTHHNTATVTGDYVQPNGQIVHLSATDPANAYVPAAPAIDIVKYINGVDANIKADRVVTDAGSTMSITYVVTNTGNVALDNVVVTDPTIGSVNITCPASVLEPAETETCTATFPAPAPGQYHTNTGFVRGDYVPASGPVKQVRDDDPAWAYTPAIDLTLVKDVVTGGTGAVNNQTFIPADTTASPGVIRVDRPFQYRLTVTNTAVPGAEPQDAHNVSLADVLDASGAVTVTGLTPSQGTCDVIAGTCNLGTIPVGASVTVLVDAMLPRANVALVPATRMLVNNAQIAAADEADVDSTPNNGFLPIEDDDNPAWVKLNLADLELVKKINTVDNGVDANGTGTRATPQSEVSSTLPVAIGQEVTWGITVKNNGPDTATGVTVNDVLPAEFKFVSAPAGYNPATNTWTIGSLTSGSVVTLNIKAILAPAWALDQVTVPSRVVNVAEVMTMNEDDPDSAVGNSVVNEDDIDDAFADPIVGALGDYVWLDDNADGIQDSTETGIAGVAVQLTLTSPVLDSLGNVILPAGSTVSTVTDGTGHYLFTNLYGATYTVTFTPPSGMIVTTQNAGGNDANDSDVTAMGVVTAVLPAGTTDLTYDMGVYEVASLGNFVWEDLNVNGIQDLGEPPVVGATVTLFGGASPVVTTTDATGHYLFDNLRPGTYHVEVTLPAGYAGTVQDTPADDAVDSDINLAGVMPATTLVSGEHDMTWDAGIVKLGSIGNLVWEDINQDGIQDSTEIGIQGATVTVTSSTGAVVATVQTAADGTWGVTNLYPGTYHVVFTLPAGYTVSPTNTGADVTVDSNGLTPDKVLGYGEDDPTIDLGAYRPLDLKVAKSLVPTPGNSIPGSTVVWKLVVTNNGPSAAAPGVTVHDQLPGELTLVSITPPAGWQCNQSTVSCVSTVVLPAGSSAEFTVTSILRKSGLKKGQEVVNTAEVTSPQVETSVTNNVTSATIKVTQPSKPVTGLSLAGLVLWPSATLALAAGLIMLGRRRRRVAA